LNAAVARIATLKEFAQPARDIPGGLTGIPGLQVF
jgi:hypothetical protein